MRFHAFSTAFLLSALPVLVSCSFNLNTVGEDWSYTADHLASTTSQKCKDAYSATIDCDYTLVGLVASMRPPFKPTTADYDATCTTTCADSVASYISSVQAACTLPGDKAQNSEDGGIVAYMGGTINPAYITLDPVEVIGQLFQYTLVQECRKSSDGTYCNKYALKYAETIACNDECSLGFFQTAHDYPASAYMFIYYWLTDRGSWWAGAFADGWKRVQECGKAATLTSSAAAMTSTSSSWASIITIPPTKSSAASTIESSSNTSASKTSDSASSVTSTTASGSVSSKSATETSSASASKSSTTSTIAPSATVAPATKNSSGNMLDPTVFAFGVATWSLVLACFWA